MKKKKIIIAVIILVILIAVGIGAYVVYTNYLEEKEAEDRKKRPENLYTSVVKDLTDEDNNYSGLYCFFADLDKDDVPEMIAGYGYDAEEYTVYSIVEDKAKEVYQIGKDKVLCLIYDIAGDKYLYGYADIELEDTGYNMSAKNVKKVYPITKVTENPKEYDVTSKEYKEKYITIPYSQSVMDYMTRETFYNGDDEIKGNIKDSLKDMYTLEDLKAYYSFDIESLKEENEASMNAPSKEEAEKIAEELYKYVSRMSENVKLDSEAIEIENYQYGQEILNYEEAFETKYTKDFIERYWNVLGNHYYIMEKNNKKYWVTPGIGGNMTYIGEERTFKEATEEKIVFTLTAYYYEDMNDFEKGANITENYAENLKKADIEYVTETAEFVLVKEDGIWKIDAYTDLAV